MIVIEDQRWAFVAIDDNTYDGPGSPIGSGKTRKEAFDDLVEQLIDRGRHTQEEFRAWAIAEGFLPPERSKLDQLI